MKAVLKRKIELNFNDLIQELKTISEKFSENKIDISNLVLDEKGDFEYLDKAEYTLIDNPKKQQIVHTSIHKNTPKVTIKALYSTMQIYDIPWENLAIKNI